MMPTAGPMSDLKVIELTAAQFGPQVGMFLADWGADVVKIENPRSELSVRTPMQDVRQAYYHAANRNKRSLALNLKDPRGKAIVLQLIDNADVFVHNVRQGAIERLGLGYEALAARNPRLIYAACTGFGPSGPYNHFRSLDGIAQALGGLVGSTGSAGRPVPAGATVVDMASSFVASAGILLALRARDRDGVGQRVDASLLNSAIYLQMWESTIYLNLGIAPKPGDTGHHLSNHLFSSIYNVYEAQDGHLMIATVADATWPMFCLTLGLEELIEDDRFSSAEQRLRNHDALRELIQASVRKKNLDYLLDALRELDVACAPVRSVEQMFDDPQVQHNDLVRSIKDPYENASPKYVIPPASLSRTPWTIRRLAPDLGEHTAEILATLGFSEEGIDQLVSEGVVKAKDTTPREVPG